MQQPTFESTPRPIAVCLPPISLLAFRSNFHFVSFHNVEKSQKSIWKIRGEKQVTQPEPGQHWGAETQTSFRKQLKVKVQICAVTVAEMEEVSLETVPSQCGSTACSSTTAKLLHTSLWDTRGEDWEGERASQCSTLVSLRKTISYRVACSWIPIHKGLPQITQPSGKMDWAEKQEQGKCTTSILDIIKYSTVYKSWVIHYFFVFC